MHPGSTMTLALLLPTRLSDGFIHSMNDFPATRICMRRRFRLAAKKGGDKRHHSHRWKHEPFDFSSKFGWDDFYRKGLGHEGSRSSSGAGDGDGGESMESLEYEWHGHIPHSAVVDAIEPAISVASQHYSQVQTTSKTKALPSILLVCCGNSALPRILHDAFDTPVQVTCLDYSPVCIEMIKKMYQSSCPNMDFVVGDASDLQQVRWYGDTAEQSTGKKHFDVVVDKGLLDALMCGEGFDLERLMESINGVLTPREWGVHVLICFKLSKASRRSLAEFRNNNNPSLVWDFNIPVEGSERGRACFNLARRSSNQPASNLGIEQMTTEWI